MKKIVLKTLLHTIVPILFGTIIYALWRGLHFIDATEKYFPLLSSAKLPDWLQYNLPDGLWLYALLSAITLVWKGNSSKHFFAWMLLAIILSYLTEVFQALHFIPGTFDWKDLVAYSFAVLFYAFHLQNFNQQFFTFKKRIK